MSAGKLEHIWIKGEHGGEMFPADVGTLEAGDGLVGDVNHGGKRQVTLIDVQHWDAVQTSLGATIDPSSRRANIMVSGISLEETKGKILVLGEARVRIQGETKPCMLMDQAFDGLQEALRPSWGGGAYAEVLEGGMIQIGDAVHWESAGE